MLHYCPLVLKCRGQNLVVLDSFLMMRFVHDAFRVQEAVQNGGRNDRQRCNSQLEYCEGKRAHIYAVLVPREATSW